MKVIIAPDSFKDSLSAQAIAEAIACGWQSVFPEAEIIICPMADGGEGSIEAVLEVCAGEWCEQSVQGPLGESVVAKWGWLNTEKIALIEMAQASGIQKTKFVLAADVTNPLCGENGASHIFAPQKGATSNQVLQLDQSLAHFADISAQLLAADKRNEPGTGAAGGLGFAAKAYLNAEFRSGIEVIAELNQLSNKIQGADWVITGEGKFDGQTLNGKTPFGVAQIAQRANVPVIVIAGTLGENYQELYQSGVSAAFSLTAGPINLEEACMNAAHLIYERTIDIARLIKISSANK